MKCKLIIPFIAGLFLAFVTIAEARQHRLVLNMHHKVYSSIIPRLKSSLNLKKEIRRQYPHLRLQLKRAELNRVRLVAKSLLGSGRVKLKAGSWSSPYKRVDGDPSDFLSNANNSYDKVNFYVPNFVAHRGKWTMKFKGTIKVRRIMVNFETRRRFFP